MAQRQMRSDDTSVWPDKFGSGSDGAYSPSTSTDAPIDSACTGTISTNTLSATNGSFTAGQLILIHQTRGTGAGQWELNKISSYAAGTITTAYPLIYGYVTSAQVMVMPQNSSGNIAGGVTVTGKAWDGSVGGIYARFCNGTFTIAGTLNVAGIGFRGGTGVAGTGGANSGESSAGASANQRTANGMGGGGGGGTDDAGGGGGGYATGGTAGSKFGGGIVGDGGGTGGDASLIALHLGGAGGGGQDNGGTPGARGGNSGGSILIIAKTITVTGTIVDKGETPPAPGVANGGGGGGGAGGSVLLKGQTLTLGSSLIDATGVAGSIFSSNGGGTGGNGRIHADYLTSISGTTSPTIDSRQDNSLIDDNAAFFFSHP